jgi:DNA adenine methylase
MKLKPIIKWAGGKRQIMSAILQEFPREFNDYYEPFVGGGSVFMEMSNREILDDSKNIYLSDLMSPLIAMYSVVRDYCEELLLELSRDVYINEKEKYDDIKKLYNTLKESNERDAEQSVKLVALFIFLNKTGFNGLYRENLSGKYNVPFGKQKSPTMINETCARELSEFLKKDNVHVKCASYEHIEETVKNGDFVYLDPPYYNTFTQYTNNKFEEDQQIQLKAFFQLLSNKGCKVALSNSDHPFIRELYNQLPGVRIIEIDVKRVINSKGQDRKLGKKELLIVNY